MPDGVPLPKTCFVICPLGVPTSEARRRSDKVMSLVVRPAVEPLGYTVTRADLAPDHWTVPDSISKHIMEDDLVIADLTDCNPNVFYELGRRHALGGRCVHLTQSIEGIPFDVRHYRVIEYNLADPEALDNVRKEVRLHITAQERGEAAPPVTLTPGRLVALTKATLVIDYHEDRKGHYELAQKVLSYGCRKIFLMQRSSTLVLGPEQGWGGEKLFYDALMREINAGAEFLHVVSIDGILHHVRRESSVFPHVDEAISQLSKTGNHVAVAGPHNQWFIKKVLDEAADPEFKADRQARTLVVERNDGIVEGLLVADLGARQGWFHMMGPRMATFMERCYDFYYECNHLTSEDLAHVRNVAAEQGGSAT